MTESFELDSRLKSDTYLLAELSLSTALLSKDANYPWLILVPRIAGVKELIDLSIAQQQQLLLESNTVSQFICDFFNAEKLNVAALGNVVAQLHVHHIGRFASDAAWPGPVWNAVPAISYTTARVQEITTAFEAYITTRSDL
ncbi:HIT domain-containing protein [Alteromonas sp. ASW11-36]|uniref:HIT domain-containing protein n=1 Tax=Alteromonas arenosi TaxID=3055817 RepID=A0ABT7SYB1_9ALTE|nr:HIT domain-containing protein [Alteromonas sp. ASW11-36]MDM7861171.1 HIT domain-containing protein [Alteromonas sp. ASW11-36]